MRSAQAAAAARCKEQTRLPLGSPGRVCCARLLESAGRLAPGLLIAFLAALPSYGVQTATPQDKATIATKKTRHRRHAQRPAVAPAAHSSIGASAAATRRPRTTTQAAVIHENAAVPAQVALAKRRTRGKKVFYSPWTEPTFADSTAGDNTDGEDLVIRKAAVDALGRYNGTVVVSDPDSGRILSIVNQKLALKGAYQPCSTVKVMVSLASLSEGLVDPDTKVRITRRSSLSMTTALAMSNNMYFAKLGQELGFDRVQKYGKEFGLGERAGLDIPGEEAGFLAEEAPQTGVGMMTSFGDGIRLTPLELSGIIGAVANGGTLYYLQYPKTPAEIDRFVPRIKRTLDMANLTQEIRPGMMGAVEYGTARRAVFDPNSPVYGKTGTCTDTAQPGVHLGWFGSFNDTPKNRIAVVVLLTGGRGISGPIASGIAGNVYHNLEAVHYFESNQPGRSTDPAQPSLVSFQSPVLQ
jgi:penicillin-binding protein 2